MAKCLACKSFFFFSNLKGLITCHPLQLFLRKKEAHDSSHVVVDDMSSVNLGFGHHYGDRKIKPMTQNTHFNLKTLLKHQ